MRAGDLRHRVTLQQFGVRTDDGYGGGSIPYTDVTTIWAAVVPLSGRELFEARQFSPELSHTVSIRYYPGIKPSWRVKYGARILDIKTVIDVEERHREIELMCEELPAP